MECCLWQAVISLTQAPISLTHGFAVWRADVKPLFSNDPLLSNHGSTNQVILKKNASHTAPEMYKQLISSKCKLVLVFKESYDTKSMFVCLMRVWSNSLLSIHHSQAQCCKLSKKLMIHAHMYSKPVLSLLTGVALVNTIPYQASGEKVCPHKVPTQNCFTCRTLPSPDSVVSVMFPWYIVNNGSSQKVCQYFNHLVLSRLQ